MPALSALSPREDLIAALPKPYNSEHLRYLSNNLLYGILVSRWDYLFKTDHSIALPDLEGPPVIDPEEAWAIVDGVHYGRMEYCIFPLFGPYHPWPEEQAE